MTPKYLTADQVREFVTQALVQVEQAALEAHVNCVLNPGDTRCQRRYDELAEQIANLEADRDRMLPQEPTP